jgi:hypothetical protein
MLRGLIFGLVAAALAVSEAAACSLAPPMMLTPALGETEEAFHQRVAALRAEEEAARLAQVVDYQRQTWDEAAWVVVARVVRREVAVPMRDDRGRVYGNTPRARMRVVRWLKGDGQGRPQFSVRYAGMTSCGPFGGGDAVLGEVGEEFVVFLSAGRLAESRVTESFALDRVTEPNLRALLDGAE